MPRSIWKGSIAFGLVNIPVELYSAVSSSEGRVKFRQLHKKDNSPIKYDRVCTKEEKTVPYEEIVKGYEYSKGKYVIMEEEDFRAAAVESTKAIDIQEFVDSSEIDPRYFEQPYYLLPQKGGEKAYALLREAIKKTGKVGIGNVTLRSNSMHFVAIKVVENSLVMESMRYADELVDTSSFEFPGEENVRPAELAMAEQLVGTMVGEFEPEKYSDKYKDNLMEIINAKLKGQKIEVAEPEEQEATNVVDLMARLQQSLEHARSEGKGERGKGTQGERVKGAGARNKGSGTRKKAKASKKSKAA